MQGFLIVNPRSGAGSPGAEELAAQAPKYGVEARILRPGEDASELARTADATALGVAGGDGSLAPVASVAVERELPFVCVPFGTRNHFVRIEGPGRLRAAIDGEPVELESPVELRIEPRALRVLLPQRS